MAPNKLLTFHLHPPKPKLHSFHLHPSQNCTHFHFNNQIAPTKSHPFHLPPNQNCTHTKLHHTTILYPFQLYQHQIAPNKLHQFQLYQHQIAPTPNCTYNKFKLHLSRILSPFYSQILSNTFTNIKIQKINI